MAAEMDKKRAAERLRFAKLEVSRGLIGPQLANVFVAEKGSSVKKCLLEMHDNIQIHNINMG